MNWFKRLVKWFRGSNKPIDIRAPSATTQLIHRLAKNNGMYHVKLGMMHEMEVYSSNISQLLDWMKIVIRTIEFKDYVPESWKRNPEKLKSMTLDDYLFVDGIFQYPAEMLDIVLRRAERIEALMTQEGMEDYLKEYYQRQFSPVFDDVLAYLNGVHKCTKWD